MTRYFTAIVCFAAVMLAATSAQGCGNPGDELRAGPVPAKIETSAQQTKHQPTTELGGK